MLWNSSTRRMTTRLFDHFESHDLIGQLEVTKQLSYLILILLLYSKLKRFLCSRTFSAIKVATIRPSLSLKVQQPTPTWNHSPLGRAGLIQAAKKMPLTARSGQAMSMMMPWARSSAALGKATSSPSSTAGLNRPPDNWGLPPVGVYWGGGGRFEDRDKGVCRVLLKRNLRRSGWTWLVKTSKVTSIEELGGGGVILERAQGRYWCGRRMYFHFLEAYYIYRAFSFMADFHQ